MNKKTIAVKTLAAISVSALAVMLAAGCLSHVLSGGRQTQMYSVSSVSAHFAALGPGYIFMILILVLSFIFSLSEKKDKTPSLDARKYRRAPEKTAKSKTAQRTVIFAFSILLIVLGIMNGGLKDVFIKAVNICTECIGLG